MSMWTEADEHDFQVARRAEEADSAPVEIPAWLARCLLVDVNRLRHKQILRDAIEKTSIKGKNESV